jgi:predicted nucleotide-binding protein
MAARAQAKAIAKRLEGPTVEILPWWDAFVAGATLLDNLARIAGEVDAALLVVTPESESVIRGRTVAVPNLNVLFELGYFLGRLAPGHTAMARVGDVYLPSDLGGWTHISGGSTFRRGGTVRVGRRTVSELERWVAAV